MKSQILNEINRQREIMGLSLLQEQSKWEGGNFKVFAAWLAEQKTNVLTMFQKMFAANNDTVDQNKETIFEVLPDIIQENDLLLTLGAGDIGSLSLKLYENYSEAIH